MRIRLYNARILTMTEGEEIFRGEIIVEDSRIVKITRYGEGLENIEAIESPDCKEIDCHGNLLMPGFKNAHTHSGMSVLRSLADDKPLWDWLTQDIFPVEAKMTGEDIYWMSQLSVLEYLTSGITACFDMYMEQLDVAKAMDDMGFRCVQTSGANDFSSDIYQQSKTYDALQGGDFSSLQTYICGCHAEYTTKMENLMKIREQVHAKKSPFFSHACETKSEVEGCVERYGKTPVAFLASLGLFDFGGGIFHGVHMSDEDLDVMQQKGLCVVTNPGSNSKLASGIAPVMEYQKRGIPVAIGTDGPASNNCLDFFREMFLVTGLAKLRENDAAALDAREVLKMATVNGAKAMRLDDCDVLAEGKKADIIMIDLNMPNMQPINNIEKNIVYSGSKINIKMTMVDGKVLYQDGRFSCGVEPETIYAKVTEIKERLISKGS